MGSYRFHLHLVTCWAVCTPDFMVCRGRFLSFLSSWCGLGRRLPGREQAGVYPPSAPPRVCFHFPQFCARQFLCFNIWDNTLAFMHVLNCR